MNDDLTGGNRLELAGLVVGLSISEGGDPGMPQVPGVDTLVRTVTDALLARGSGVVLGHDWRPKGGMDGALEAARVLRRSGDVRHRLLHNLVPWPDRPESSDSERRELAEVLVVESAGLPPALASRGDPVPSRDSEEFVYLRARGLTWLRRRMVELESARICMGGRIGESSGRYPGVVEEALLSLRAGHPVYITALLGGAAARMVAAIEDGRAPGPGFAPTRRDVVAAFARNAALWEPGEPDARIDEGAVGEEIARFDLALLSRSNGLSVDENRALFHATTLEQVLELVIRGLGKLKLQGRFDAQGRCRTTTWRGWFASFGLEYLVPPDLAKHPWQPTEQDREAAWLLYTELSTRITTRELHYRSGDVGAALESVYQLFPKTREILARQGSACAHFAGLALAVLDGRVRRFTSKWHGRKTDGKLKLLDQGNEFRADLEALQPTLQDFERALGDLSGASPRVRTSSSEEESRPPDAPEMGSVTWYPTTRVCEEDWNGGWRKNPPPGSLLGEDVLRLERAAIAARRRTKNGSAAGMVGLALSGGGIRSATFCLGVLQELAEHDILDQVDYLSTVSGGGYTGCFLSHSLAKTTRTSARTLLDEGSRAMRCLRKRADNHLLGSTPTEGAFELVFALARGWLVHAIALFAVLAVAVRFDPILDGLSRVLLEGRSAWFGLGVVAALAVAAVMARRAAAERCLRTTAAIVVFTFLGAVTYRAGEWLFDSLLSASGPLSTSVSTLATGSLASRLLPFVRRRRWLMRVLLEVAVSLIVPVLIGLAYFGLRGWLPTLEGIEVLAVLAAWAAAVFVVVVVPVNRCAPHAVYRRRLVDAFLRRGRAVSLSSLARPTGHAPVHLVNATVNLPGSRALAARGRRSDVFVFSPFACGSAATAWFPTASLEKQDPDLDLGTAMAISGAAVSSHMGNVAPARRASLLALANLRLGYWLPNLAAKRPGEFAGLNLLWNEISGSMREDASFVNVSDGGHLENLGVYELFRRRCRFIIAVDAEADEGLHCDGLIKALRQVRVDFRVKVDIDLDDLTRAADGTTRTHFALGWIIYPDNTRGYLLYVKASVSGDEDRALLEYRRRHPAFPHESTGDQFFDEEQFESYRLLGRHIGTRLFVEPFVETAAEQRASSLPVDAWLDRLRANLFPEDHLDQEYRCREHQVARPATDHEAPHSSPRRFAAPVSERPRTDPRRLHL